MRIRITAGGIYDGKGAEIPVGHELDVADFEVDGEGQPVEPHPWGGRFIAIGESKKGKKTVTNPAKDQPKFEARAKGDEWFIFDADGKEQGATLPEKDAKDFNGLSDDLKAAFVAEHTKA